MNVLNVLNLYQCIQGRAGKIIHKSIQWRAVSNIHKCIKCIEWRAVLNCLELYGAVWNVFNEDLYEAVLENISVFPEGVG